MQKGLKDLQMLKVRCAVPHPGARYVQGGRLMQRVVDTAPDSDQPVLSVEQACGGGRDIGPWPRLLQGLAIEAEMLTARRARTRRDMARRSGRRRLGEQPGP